MVSLRLRAVVKKPPWLRDSCVRPPEVKPGTAVPSTSGVGVELGGGWEREKRVLGLDMSGVGFVFFLRSR